MSVLECELSDLVGDDYSSSDAVIALRLVDTATRLHAWSIPVPCCIHGSPLDQRCEGCDGVAPLDPADEQI
jgi:hypothetical protein